MPAEIVVMMDCASNYGVFHVPSSTPGKFYVVTYEGSERGPHCECRGFKYAPADEKDCKHARFVWEHACLYNPQWHDGRDPDIRPVDYIYHAIVPGEECPACGGPMVAVRRAV